MLLGGTVAGRFASPEDWEKLLVESRFRAVTAPFNCHTPADEVREYCEIARRHGVRIAEVGVWRNPFDRDPAAAAAALDSLDWREVLGCIAGDDTIMCVLRSPEDGESFFNKMNEIMR